MASTTDSLPRDESPSASIAWGELVLQNGRLSEMRRSLNVPALLIGRAEECDVRLNATGVHPQHCVLMRGANGPLLRSLKGETLVNDVPVSLSSLKDGDQISVGIFRFRLDLTKADSSATPPRAATGSPSDSITRMKLNEQRERDALRIQAAAVAAQQAALTEEEIRLEKRRKDYEQQESQLSAHLEEKRLRLLELRNQARDAHAAMNQARASHDQEIAEALQAAVLQREEAAQIHEQAQAHRKRILSLRQRLKQRLHRHWLATRADLQKREESVASAQNDIQRETQALQHTREELFRERLRCNSDAEIGRRKLLDAETQMNREVALWKEHRARELALLERRVKQLASREAEVLDLERDRATKEKLGEEQRSRLQRETEGLEQRIRNQRLKLVEQEKALSLCDGRLREERQRLSLPSLVESDSSAHATPDSTIEHRERLLRESENEVHQRLATLELFSQELAEQRSLLSEQCERLAQAKRAAQQECEAAAAELEPLARRLEERELELAKREREVEPHEDYLFRLQAELTHARQHLEAWQARLTMRSTAWEGERDRLLTDLRKREALAEQHVAALAKLRLQWQERRNIEVQRLEARLVLCEKLRKECVRLRDQWLERGESVELERRTLASRALGLQAYRQKALENANDPKAAEQRLERLEIEWASEFTASAHAALQERAALAQDFALLEEQATALQREIVAQDAREKKFAEQTTQREKDQTRIDLEVAKVRQELISNQMRNEVYERQLRESHDEIDRLARVILEEVAPDAVQVARAA